MAEGGHDGAWYCGNRPQFDDAGLRNFCPPEGCPKGYCARDDGWKFDEPSPDRCTGIMRSSPQTVASGDEQLATVGEDHLCSLADQLEQTLEERSALAKEHWTHISLAPDFIEEVIAALRASPPSGEKRALEAAALYAEGTPFPHGTCFTQDFISGWEGCRVAAAARIRTLSPTPSKPGPDAVREALAHELWAMAQLSPGEGIEDGVARIKAALRPDARSEVE